MACSFALLIVPYVLIKIAAKEAEASDATCDTSAAIRCLLALLFEFETLAYLGRVENHRVVLLVHEFLLLV